MEFGIDTDDAAFQEEVRAFIAGHRPKRAPMSPSGAPYREVLVEWTRALRKQGWLAPHWPVQWGGQSWSAQRRYLLQLELTLGMCPPTDGIALDMVGPVICTFGTEEQKNRYLPPILNGDELWCQGFSESHAGSDVLAVKTRAMRDRDSYVVTGRKIWITYAHVADMMFALVRVSANGKQQQGLTFLLIDMKSKGIEVRPIMTIDGQHIVNEVSFEDVRVPLENRIGEEGKGWIYARSLLSHERALIAGVPLTRQRIDALEGIVRAGERTGDRTVCSAAFRNKLARLKVDATALEFAMYRVLYAAPDDRSLDSLTSMLKIRGAELRQRSSGLLLEAMGERGLVLDYPADHEAAVSARMQRKLLANPSKSFLYDRATSIAGGSSEVQRNIIAAAAMAL